MTHRRRHASVALATAGLAAVAALVVPATAEAAPTGSSVVGDVNGDGLRDRVTLTDVGTPAAADCAALVRLGRADGTFAAARTVHLDTPANAGDGAVQVCPTAPTVLTGTRPGLDRLAATYVSSVDERPTQVYNLTGPAISRGAVAATTTFAGGLGGGFGTADFDGDGNLDFWRQGTDQGEGSAFWQRRGEQFVQIYSSGYNPGIDTPGSGFQFVDLNRAGGTDVLVSTINPGASFAAVVDGKTGAVRVLMNAYTVDGRDIYGYSIATVDLNHDRYPDIVVQPLADDGPDPAARYFVNTSQGGRWQFAPYGSGSTTS